MRKFVHNKKSIILLAALILVLSVFGVSRHLGPNQSVQAIKAMSWVAAGRTIIVDPGHGGEDPGKVSPAGIYEKNINLAVGKKLYAVLNDSGAQVVMTREEDKALSQGEDTIRLRKRADLLNRMELAREHRADLYIALHCNSFPQSRWKGAQTFYAPSVAGSKELAEFIQVELEAYLRNTQRKPKSDTTSLIFKEAHLPIVNIEMGFLSNPEEEKLLQDPAYQDKIVWAIYSGVVRYLAEYGDSFRPAMKMMEK
ncbi:MAG: N-acetylmuramoyl-L-alanine amidase [Clostridia bacterium]|jgi:N-acetylmuramoyl-L-alanine amidase|nr:N-acetylmuramoyl-L-alanine amidase [Clostridia bacterium]